MMSRVSDRLQSTPARAGEPFSLAVVIPASTRSVLTTLLVLDQSSEHP